MNKGVKIGLGIAAAVGAGFLVYGIIKKIKSHAENKADTAASDQNVLSQSVGTGSDVEGQLKKHIDKVVASTKGKTLTPLQKQKMLADFEKTLTRIPAENRVAFLAEFKKKLGI